MCVAALAWMAHPRWKLVAIGNRDEFHGRPTAPLARWADGRIVAGRDLQAGGTWLGVAQGRFALVTNHRAEGYPKPELASRGALVSDWLRGNDSGDVTAMNPFNLWLAGSDELEFVTNHPSAQRISLEPGIHGLSNGPREERWFKTARLEAALADWLDDDQPLTALLDPLADGSRDPADGDNPFAAVFIGNASYGTRCSSVIAVNAAGQGTIIERSFDALGAQTGTVELGFDWG
jgi:uncharacterized protein with NRDE domain